MFLRIERHGALLWIGLALYTFLLFNKNYYILYYPVVAFSEFKRLYYYKVDFEEFGRLLRSKKNCPAY